MLVRATQTLSVYLAIRMTAKRDSTAILRPFRPRFQLFLNLPPLVEHLSSRINKTETSHVLGGLWKATHSFHVLRWPDPILAFAHNNALKRNVHMHYLFQYPQRFQSMNRQIILSRAPVVQSQMTIQHDIKRLQLQCAFARSQRIIKPLQCE